ncbi:serine hydrolase [Chitinophaga agrisoli]|uniref:Serine hydrolase n=1 Tax=Chitinophaga agrisoli TaxID=2607653 RepID=A0A5B2VG32_9BACT|nr:serine hydrolase [Chitinophaga agrisoli]KAA2238503.1 serine hydrolase [Chitinophaga agrisoli]
MRTLMLLLLFPVLFSCRSSAQDAAKIDQLLGKYYEYGQFNGTVLVAKAGKIIFKKGYGYANFEWDILNTTDTKFRLGSITKQFTAMLILQLVEKGKIRLDGKVTDYLPYYPKDNGGKITVYQLLTHTAGVPNYTALPEFFSRYARNAYTPREFIPVFAELPLEFSPGSKYKYSNSGYFILGAIIEAVSGKPYDEVLHENILRPLHMNNTGYDTAATVIKKRADGYMKRRNGYEHAEYLDMSLPFAAGAMYSTVEDLYLWDQALYTEQLLNKDSKHTYFTPYLDGYACGWVRKPINLGKTTDTLSAIWHGGGINGFVSLIVRIPGTKDLVVLLNNTGGTDLEDMARGILGILHDKPYDLPIHPAVLPPAVQQLITASQADTAAYRTYAGSYLLGPGVVMTITVEGSRIYEQVTGQRRYEIFPQSPGKFFMRVVDAQITFTRDEQGKVDGLVLHQGGRDVPGKRVTP